MKFLLCNHIATFNGKEKGKHGCFPYVWSNQVASEMLRYLNIIATYRHFIVQGGDTGVPWDRISFSLVIALKKLTIGS